MTRIQCSSILALAALAGTASAVAAGEATTTRIETRPFYGATVTIEEGVRVYRPLPTIRHMVINPDGKTPLSLNLYDYAERSYPQNYNYNYNYVDGGAGRYSYGGIGFPEGTPKAPARQQSGFPVGGRRN